MSVVRYINRIQNLLNMDKMINLFLIAIVEEDDSSSVVGLAVGLTLLFIIIIIIIVVIIWYFMKRRKRQKLQNEIKYNISSFKRKLKVRGN